MIPVVLACCSRDQDQALRVLNWTAELGFNYADFFLLCSKECKVTELMEIAAKAFSSVKWIQDVEEVDSNWFEIGHHKKSAAGPNSLFRQAAWHFYGPYITKAAPPGQGWLFWEPDAIPCHKDWLRDISDEYSQCGKAFLGFEVTRATHPGDVGNHMSGVAVYPLDVPLQASGSIAAGDTAFDIEGAARIMERVNGQLVRMAPSRTIFHRYRPPSFETQTNFEERVPKHLAIYHACKDGSIIPFLRQRLGMKGDNKLPVPPVPTEIVASIFDKEFARKVMKDANAPLSELMGVCDIFIKTRPHDYPWLEWCMKSITKHCHEPFREAIFQCPESLPWSLHPGRREVTSTDREPGYLWQQVCKLYADQHTDAEWILYMDSDCVFTRPVSPSDFIKDGKPIWLYTPLDQARPDQHVWAPVMEKFLGKKPEHEFMRRHPFIVQRWMLDAIRTFCKYRHGCTLEEYIMAQAVPGSATALTFSEWNCLGFFLWEYHRDKVAWVLDSEAGPACVYQGFTHGGEARKQEDLAKFKELLEGNPEEGDIASGVVPSDEKSLSVAGKHDLTVPSAIEFLASQVKNNLDKARIVKALKKAWAGKGEAPKRKAEPLPVLKRKVITKRNGTLLCIHSYPGANETLLRHWPHFCEFGADRIVGIGTVGGGTQFPCESVEIGENRYMKMKGKDDNLCRRLLNTVKWCLSQPEERFAILEYDTLVLRRMPHWQGINASLTGGKINGSHTNQFYHNPWLFDRQSGESLVRAMEDALGDSAEYPNNSPDLFFGLACERAGIKVGCNFKLFTRNTLDHDLDLACEAARLGVHVIHGVKTKEQYNAIMESLRLATA